MSAFIITQVDPSRYKRQIIALWENNLPDAPEGRFEWMANNPEGAAVWYVAIHKKTKEVAGSISIMPRRVKIKGKIHLAGITGDFMVKKEYRIFGPTLPLIKTVIRNYPKLGFDFLYTFPNQASEKMALRAGFQKIGLVSRLAKPLKIKHQLTKYIHPALASFIAPGFELGLRLISKETYIRSNGSFQELAQLIPDYNQFWGKIENIWSILGERSSEYLNWKYFQNPLSRFHMFVYKEALKEAIMGYIIFTVVNNSAHIFDIFTNKKDTFQKIMTKSLKIFRKFGYQTVSITIFRNNPLFSYIKSFGFLDLKEDVSLLFTGDANLMPQEWLFFQGDIDI